MAKTGKEAYNDKYDRMSVRRIEKCCFADEWKLTGFYHSLLIKESYNTAYQYLGHIINFMTTCGADIQNIDVDDYYGFMASLKNTSSSKQIGVYHALQKYSRYLKSKNICEDYMAYIERPKFVETQETVDKREKGYLTKKEAKRLINYVEESKGNNFIKSRDYAIMMIFLTTGIRCSAMYKLDINNVDLENKTITVHEKGSKNRIVSLPDQTVEAIKQWLYYRSEYLGDISENALIVSTQKKRMQSESIYYAIKKFGKIITGKNITPHKLRATFGTELYRKTKDLYFVQSCMGHTSPKTTEIYIRGQKSDMTEKAANLMNDFLN